MLFSLGFPTFLIAPSGSQSILKCWYSVGCSFPLFFQLLSTPAPWIQMVPHRWLIFTLISLAQISAKRQSHGSNYPLDTSSSGEGNGTLLQYSCLENPMDGGAWQAAVHGVAKSRTRLSNFTLTFHFHSLEKEMATHSSVLAWRIPETGEPGGLTSIGSHRVGHD